MRSAVVVLLTALVMMLLGGSITPFLPAHAQLPQYTIVQVFWGDSSGTFQPLPGDKRVPLSVIVQNTGDDTITSMSAQLQLTGTPFTDSTGGTSAFAGSTTSLVPGATATLVFTLNILNEARLGSYNIPIQASIRSSKFSNNVVVQSTIPLSLLGKVSFSLRSQPNNLNLGSNSFSVIISNTGSATASSVDVSFTMATPITRTDRDTKFSFPSISAISSVTANMALFVPFSAAGTTSTITASISYTDAYGFARTETRSLGVVINNGTIQFGRIQITQVSWGDPVNDSGVRPGDGGTPLFVTIRNVSNNTITGVSSTLFLARPFKGTNGEEMVTAATGDIRPAQTGTLRFVLDVSSSAELKSYELTLVVNYLVLNPLSVPVVYLSGPTSELTVPVPVKGRSNLTVKTSGETLSTGATSKYKIDIMNSGTTDVNSLDISLSLPSGPATAGGSSAVASPIILSSGDNKWHFDYLPAGGLVSIEPIFTTSDESAGNYVISISLSYKDVTGVVKSEARSIGLKVESRITRPVIALDSFALSSNDIKQGQTFSVSFTVTNIGDAVAQAATVDMQIPNIFSSLVPTLVNVGTLPPDVSKNISYDLIVSPSAPTGSIQKLNFVIAYNDEQGRAQQSTTSIGVPIHGIIELRTVGMTVTPDPLGIGQPFSATFTLLNTGTISASFTNVSVVPEGPVMLEKDSSVYLGAVDPNAPVPVSINGAIGSDAQPGNYILKIRIEYKDEYQAQKSTVLKLPIRADVAVFTKKPENVAVGQFSLPNLSIFIVPVVVVAVAGVVIALRRGRRHAQ